jgi:hypothetical protein
MSKRLNPWYWNLTVILNSKEIGARWSVWIWIFCHSNGTLKSQTQSKDQTYQNHIGLEFWCLNPLQLVGSYIFLPASYHVLYMVLRDCRGRVGILVNFHNYRCNQCLSPLTFWVRIPVRRGVLDTKLCDKVWWIVSPNELSCPALCFGIDGLVYGV